MNVAGILSRARALQADALGQMDACAITRVTRGALNESTGAYASTSASVYTGACRIKAAPVGTEDVATIDADATRPQMALPYSATGSSSVAAGDTVTMTSGALSGAVYTVHSVDTVSDSSARRFIVERVLS